MGIANLTAATWIEAVSALGALIVAVLAASFAIREHRNARESFIQQMRSEWRLLGKSWARILLAQHGSDFHYADASASEREKARQLREALLTDEDLEPGYTAALELRADVRPVTRFLSYAADSVLRGRWTVGEAYDVLGPDVARHHKTIRLLAHRERANLWFEQAIEFNTHDEQDCLYLFAYLIRAEQCRRGDTYGHFVVELAKDLRVIHKGELSACIRRVKRVRHLLWLPDGVQFLLWRGRHPRVGSVYLQTDAPIIISGSERQLFRRPLEPTPLLRLRIWWARHRSGTKNAGVLAGLAALSHELSRHLRRPRDRRQPDRF